MYTHPSHRQLKNRTLKRRVTSHHYTPQRTRNNDQEYASLRANQTALSKIKYQPELLCDVRTNLEVKKQQAPADPHLQKWQQLLDDLEAGKCSLAKLSEKVMGYDNQAKALREAAVLDCLYED